MPPVMGCTILATMVDSIAEYACQHSRSQGWPPSRARTLHDLCTYIYFMNCTLKTLCCLMYMPCSFVFYSSVNSTLFCLFNVGNVFEQVRRGPVSCLQCVNCLLACSFVKSVRCNMRLVPANDLPIRCTVLQVLELHGRHRRDLIRCGMCCIATWRGLPGASWHEALRMQLAT